MILKQSSFTATKICQQNVSLVSLLVQLSWVCACKSLRPAVKYVTLCTASEIPLTDYSSRFQKNSSERIQSLERNYFMGVFLADHPRGGCFVAWSSARGYRSLQSLIQFCCHLTGVGNLTCYSQLVYYQRRKHVVTINMELRGTIVRGELTHCAGRT